MSKAQYTVFGVNKMILKNAGQFRKFCKLTIAETAHLANIDETDCILIEAGEKEAKPDEAARLAALYNVTVEELSGEHTDRLGTPKKDVWHFFPPNESIYPKNSVSFDNLSIPEKEIIAAFRNAEADVKDAVFKTLTDNTLARRLVESEQLAERKAELDRLDARLTRREVILDEREEAILKILYGEAEPDEPAE